MAVRTATEEARDQFEVIELDMYDAVRELRLAGDHLEVSNLVFRDGWAPGGEVVSFRRSASEWANHSRVTGIVIDRYNKPDRQQSDHWVALYGPHNRFDHNQLVGKTNGWGLRIPAPSAAAPGSPGSTAT